MKAPAAGHPLPAERASNQESNLLPGEKVADGGGRMRGYFPNGNGEKPTVRIRRYNKPN
jgi:hypothetical protein